MPRAPKPTRTARPARPYGRPPRAPPKMDPKPAGSQPQPNYRASSTWSPQADRTLIAARAQGLNWLPITLQHFPDKTPNACRKRHERLMERRNVEDWDTLKLEGLATEYMLRRRDIWSPLANALGEKWQVVEAKCMEKGLKNLMAAARSAGKRAKGTPGEAEDDSGGHDSADSDDAGEGSKPGASQSEPAPANPQQQQKRSGTGPTIASLLSPMALQ